MNYSSKLIEEAVNAFASLPGVGKKTALRYVIHLLNRTPDITSSFVDAIAQMRTHIKFCKTCHNVSDHDICGICSNPKRDHTTICIVESIRDLMAIEDTQQFRGTYHVLGGVISPINGIGPDALTIDALIERIDANGVKEIIMAISPTIDGDTTIYYISKKIGDRPVKISTISRGVSFGGELEYADEITLARSIVSRVPYQN